MKQKVKREIDEGFKGWEFNRDRFWCNLQKLNKSQLINFIDLLICRKLKQITFQELEEILKQNGN